MNTAAADRAELRPALPREAAVLRLVDVTARWQYRLLRSVVFRILRLLFRIEVQGTDRIPGAGPYVVAANHLNWPDGPLLLMAFPLIPRINFVADSEFVRNSALLWLVVRWLGGVLPVVANGHASMALPHAVRACLERRGSVGFFPEGRYGDSEEMPGPFHRGFASVAIVARVPVVPAQISGTKELWLGKRLTVTIGDPISPAGHTAATLTAATRDRIAAMRPAPLRIAGRRLFRRFLTRLFP